MAPPRNTADFKSGRAERTEASGAGCKEEGARPASTKGMGMTREGEGKRSEARGGRC